jgi:uncharacterized protein (DUF2147 family)
LAAAWFAAGACAAAAQSAPPAQPAATQPGQPPVVGTWERENGDARIRVGRCGEVLCGTLTWTARPRIDENNPDPALRRRSLVGVNVFFDMKPGADGRWEGQAYNPEDGRNYSASMVVAGGTLSTEGCVLGGLICRSVSWKRID